MWNFVVCALMKNESHCLREWIEHYLYHGADHIFLIDDDSTDNSLQIAEEYVEKGVVTLFKANGWGKYLGRQRNMYNHFFMPLAKEKKAEWMLICDLDEFVWSPSEVDLKKFLSQVKHLACVQVLHTLFGSNGHVTQPRSVVAGFTKRHPDIPSGTVSLLYKYFINTDYSFTSLNVHYPDFSSEEDKHHRFRCFGPEYLRINHYQCQSVEFWNGVKCTRGDSDGYRQRAENSLDGDFNQVEDTDLMEQNRPLLERLGYL